MPPRDQSVTPEKAYELYETRRAARYDAQHVLWRVTKTRRLAYCGRFARDKTAPITVKLTGTAGTPEARAGFSNLQTCGSVWSCPVCSEKINASRQAEIQHAIECWLSPDWRRNVNQRGPAEHVAPCRSCSHTACGIVRRGNGNGGLLFGTFTFRHSTRYGLKELWDAVGPAWSTTVSGSSWHGGKRQRGIASTYGIAGWLRVVEVKRGKNGWHPHIHALFFVNEQLTVEKRDELRARLFTRWSAALEKVGLEAVEFGSDGEGGTKAVGVDLRPVYDAQAMADYFAKNTFAGEKPLATSANAAAYEVTGSQSKKAGKGGVTPFQLLEQLVSVKAASKKAGQVLREPELLGAETTSGQRLVVDKTTGEILEGLDSTFATTSDDELARLLACWYEWEEVSSGRRQLTWSRGIRDLVGLGEEISDDEIVENDDLAGSPISDIMSTNLAESLPRAGVTDETGCSLRGSAIALAMAAA